MIVVDTSVVLAILLDEPERSSFVRILAEAPLRIVSAATLLEAKIVLHGRRGAKGVSSLNMLIAHARIEIEPVTEVSAEAAFDAYLRFGKGSGHPAKLNYGDCFACALAREKAGRLLFKGGDFGHTDVEPAA